MEVKEVSAANSAVAKSEIKVVEAGVKVRAGNGQPMTQESMVELILAGEEHIHLGLGRTCLACLMSLPIWAASPLWAREFLLFPKEA